MNPTPDDTWPQGAPAVLPCDGETLPSLHVLFDRAIELDDEELEDA